MNNGPQYGLNRNTIYGLELKGKTSWHPVPNTQCVTWDYAKTQLSELEKPPNGLDRYRIVAYSSTTTKEV